MAGNGARYSDEFKQKALDLSEKIGNKKAAEQLGISSCTIDYLRYKRNKEQKAMSKNKTKPSIEKEKTQSKEIKIEFQIPQVDTNPFKRGKIYYISRTNNVGAEIGKSRPGIIVSNDNINKDYDTLEVIFLTTKIKSATPEHVMIKSSGITSLAVCEQISTIDKGRVREYIGECTEDEMKAIDRAILASMALDDYVEEPLNNDQQLLTIKAELKAYKDMYEKLLNKYLKDMSQKR